MFNRRLVPAVLAAVALACCAAALVVYPLSVLVAAGLGALTGLSVLAVVYGPDGSRSPQGRRRAITAGRDAAGLVAAAVLVITGAEVALGPATAPVVLLAVAAAAPWVWRRRARVRERYEPRPTAYGATSIEPANQSCRPSPRTADLANSCRCPPRPCAPAGKPDTTPSNATPAPTTST